MNKQDELLNAAWLWGIKIAGLVSVLGLISLNTRYIDLFYYPGGSENLWIVLAYAFCFIGLGVAVLAEFNNAYVLSQSKIALYVRFSICWLAVLCVAVGVIFAFAVSCVWIPRHHYTVDDMTPSFWREAIVFGVGLAIGWLYLTLDTKREILPDRLQKILRGRE